MTKYLRHLVYFAGFLLSFHLALPAYVNSSFLEYFLGPNSADRAVGLIFMAASVLSLIGLATVDKPIRRFGLRQSTLGFSVITIAIGLLLSLTNNPLIAIVLFILFYAGGIILKFLLDIYLEDLSDNTDTGKIRGLFLTLTNLAWLFSPLLASWLIQEINFGRIYMAAALIILPFIYLIIGPLRKVVEPKYEHASLVDGLKLLWCLPANTVEGRHGICKTSVRNSLLLSFTLNLFYAFMVIYVPLYLTKTMHLAWQDLGIIFTFMLLPFPLFQYFFGWLADKYFGEKEIMSIGLVIMAITTAAMAFINTPSILIWSALLFVNRIGACALEAMTESYFFKHIDSHNINTIGFFRNTGPLAYIVAPIIATIIFTFASYQLLFITVALICLYALRYSLTLVDTK